MRRKAARDGLEDAPEQVNSEGLRFYSRGSGSKSRGCNGWYDPSDCSVERQ